MHSPVPWEPQPRNVHTTDLTQTNLGQGLPHELKKIYKNLCSTIDGEIILYVSEVPLVKQKIGIREEILPIILPTKVLKP